MQIGFMLDEHEDKVTPIKVAEALINHGEFDRSCDSHVQELKELLAYLIVYTNYNQ